MTMITSVPDVTFGATGPVLPTEADILAGVRSDIDVAFGGGVNPALNTPQGQLASSIAAMIGDKNALFAEIVNQVNPDLADGRMQDAIGRIYYIDRTPAKSTAVLATCTGLTGTMIPLGARAQAADGRIYRCTAPGTIPESGHIDLPFACSITGPIACPEGTLNAIYQAIPGWDAIKNASDGVKGRDVESRADFENRRRQSVALNAKGALPSVRAAVLAVPGVLDAYTEENEKNVPVTIGGVTLSPHSIYVAAVGGVAADIATAIWAKKSPGCDMNGNTTVIVHDTDGYSVPCPSYRITFQIPAALPIRFAVQIANLATLPANVVQQIQAAILDAFSGGDGGARARIGSTIYASRYYAAVASIDASIEIVSILIGTAQATHNAVTVNIDQVPTLSSSNISVTLV